MLKMFDLLPCTIVGLWRHNTLLGRVFVKGLFSHPPCTPLCSAPPGWSLIGFLQIMGTILLAMHLSSGLTLTFMSPGAVSEVQSRQVRLRSVIPQGNSHYHRGRTAAWPHSINIPESPLPVTCMGRDVSCVLTKHIRRQNQLGRDKAQKDTFLLPTVFKAHLETSDKAVVIVQQIVWLPWKQKVSALSAIIRMLTGTLNLDGSRVQNRNPSGTIYPAIHM